MTALTPIRTEDFEAGVLAAERRLYAFAMGLCRDHHRAEDLVQDTIVKALAKFEMFQPGTNLNAWLYTILRNDWYSQSRRKGREVADPDGIIAGQVAVGEGQTHAFDLKVVRRRMRELNTVQRRCVELVAIQGYQYDEVAEMLGLPEGTIKSSVSRARDFLETGTVTIAAEEAAAEVFSAPSFHEHRVAAMYRASSTISQIAEATGLSRSEVMQVISDRKLRRA